MNKVTTSEELRSLLPDLDQQTEICDEQGNLMGVYLPLWAYKVLESYRKQVYASVQVPFSQEELERRAKEGGGRPLAEFWKNLGQT